MIYIKVTNKTSFETSDIKKLIYACSKLARGSKKILKHLRVEATYCRNRQGFPSGVASYGRSWMRLRLPREITTDGKRYLAHVIAHELLHTVGVRHTKKHNHLMNGQYKTETKDDPKLMFADNFEIRNKVKKAKVETDLQKLRFEKAKSKLEELDKTIKRLGKRKSKLLRTVKYYQKTLKNRKVVKAVVEEAVPTILGASRGFGKDDVVKNEVKVGMCSNCKANRKITYYRGVWICDYDWRTRKSFHKILVHNKKASL